jgi:biopolymer transport protein ExbB
MNRIFVLLSLLLIPFIYSQEVEEIDINEERNNQINELIQVIKTNKSIYVNQDNKRLNKFIDRVEERTKLLNDAKRLLANEEKRNKELEDAFESNEKELADLEEKLQIKIGVLGELFGVTRQYAGELVASNQDSVVFYEFPEREKTLKDIAVIQVHNLEQLEDLWLAYFDEIGAGSEIKTFNAKITNPSGESFEGEVTRYGLFNAVHKNNFLKPVSSLNSFQLLPKQPERSIIKSVKKHSQSTDGFSSVAIDPTRGFLLSLYLDKPGWFERIAQGRTIGFIIILIGLVGLIFSAYKIYLLNNHSNNIIENSSIDSNMSNLLKDANSRESK